MQWTKSYNCDINTLFISYNLINSSCNYLQESAVEAVHLVAALLFFLCGTLYISLQTYMSYCSYPYGSSLSVCRTRLIISVISAVVFLPSILSFIRFVHLIFNGTGFCILLKVTHLFIYKHYYFCCFCIFFNMKHL